MIKVEGIYEYFSFLLGSAEEQQTVLPSIEEELMRLIRKAHLEKELHILAVKVKEPATHQKSLKIMVTVRRNEEPTDDFIVCGANAEDTFYYGQNEVGNATLSVIKRYMRLHKIKQVNKWMES